MLRTVDDDDDNMMLKDGGHQNDQYPIQQNDGDDNLRDAANLFTLTNCTR